MASGRFVIIAALALAASGCATGGAKSHLARLQSQVGILDERVAQLERVGPAPTAFKTDSNGSSGSDAAYSKAQ